MLFPNIQAYKLPFLRSRGDYIPKRTIVVVYAYLN